MPKVSIIMPVYNSSTYLEDALDCVLGQTIRDIEVVCVNDGSTDDSLSILERKQQEDSRIKIISQPNSGAGAARNTGLNQATGEYLFFFDADDLCSRDLLEKAVKKLEVTQADFVAFNFEKLFENGKKVSAVGIHDELLPQAVKKAREFSWQDCPTKILSVVNPTPWCKVYRRQFVLDHNLAFDQLFSSNDITFCTVSVAVAKKIVYLKDALVIYRVNQKGSVTSNNKTKYKNAISAIRSTVHQVAKLDYYSAIKDSVLYFVLDNYVTYLRYFEQDYYCDEFKDYYTFLHNQFNQTELKNIRLDQCKYELNYIKFQAIKRNTYDKFCELTEGRKLIASLTSIPTRINTLSVVLDSVYNQTMKADQVILYLAVSQFPNKDADLPEDIKYLEKQGILLIKWVAGDLKAHKKYYYSFQDYSDDLIITLDDDLVYHLDMFEYLFFSYLIAPRAAHAVRVHLMIADERQGISSYNNWISEVNCFRYQPSMQLFSTNGAGTLIAPRFLNQSFFEKTLIQELCLNADDLWIKAMLVMSDMPVAAAYPRPWLHVVPGTQNETLFNTNLTENDNQMQNIVRYLDDVYGKGTFLHKLIHGVGSDSEAVLSDVHSVALASKNVIDLVKSREKRLKVKLEQAQQQNKTLANQLNDLQCSWWYKLRRKITRVPRKIKTLFSRG